MVWALDLDDFSDRCGSGPFPLLRAINEELGVSVTQPVSSATGRYSTPSQSQPTSKRQYSPLTATVPVLPPRLDQYSSRSTPSSVKNTNIRKGSSSVQSTLPKATEPPYLNSINELYAGSESETELESDDPPPIESRQSSE